MSKLLAIVGPTAGGKSAIGLALAKRYNGEIICADSRTIYRGMDIGTAKPSAADRAEVPHHLIDILDPDTGYSAAQFKTAALEVIADISSRGKLPILVGGTGLYVWAVVYDYQFPAGPRTAERAELEQQPLAELVQRLRQEDPAAAKRVDLQNPRRVIRALETAGLPRNMAKLREDTWLLGLRPPESELASRIKLRTKNMIKHGLVDEVRRIVSLYGADIEPLRTTGYSEVIQYLNRQLTYQSMEELINLHTRQLAKRQITWLKRSEDIKWSESEAEAREIAGKFLGQSKL